MKKRNTKGKQLVLDILNKYSQALSVDDIHKELEQLDRSTIYRILLSFEQDCIVHQVEVDAKIYFALCGACCHAHEHNDDHVHFKCKQCDKITCLDHSVIVTNLESGYTITHMNCLLTGICKLCN